MRYINLHLLTYLLTYLLWLLCSRYRNKMLQWFETIDVRHCRFFSDLYVCSLCRHVAVYVFECACVLLFISVFIAMDIYLTQIKDLLID